jgi:hypothetical protein
MAKPLTILTLIVSLGLTNCSQKQIYTCGLAYLDSRPGIDSKVLYLERVGIADTTIAIISGEISGKDSSEFGVTTDILIGSSVYLTDKLTGEIYYQTTDLEGKYQIHVPASTYNFKVQYISYNTLIVRDVIFGTGDIVQFYAMLGQRGAGHDSTVFIMQPDKTIKKITQPINTKKK